MSVPDVNINPDTSSKKMWIVGGFLFIVVAVAVPVLYFFVLKKSPSPKSNTCMIDQDCPVNMECKNQKCVAKSPSPESNACMGDNDCKTDGMSCINSTCVLSDCSSDSDCRNPALVCTNNNCACKNGNYMPFCKYKYIDFKNQIYQAVTPLWSKDARPSTYGNQNIYGCLDKCKNDPTCGGVHIRQTSSDKIMSATDKVAETNTLATPDFDCYIVGTDPGKALGRSSNASDSNGWTLYYKNQYFPSQ